MWVANKKLLPLFFVPGVVFLVIGFLADPSSRADDGTSLRTISILIGVGWIALVLATLAGTYLYNAHVENRAKRLRAGGLTGMATILSSRATGDTLNNIPLVEMELRVEVEGRSPYNVKHREHINPVNLAALQPGVRVPVLVDPGKPKKVYFDWN